MTFTVQESIEYFKWWPWTKHMDAQVLRTDRKSKATRIENCNSSIRLNHNQNDY